MLEVFCLKSVSLNKITFLLTFLKLIAQSPPDYQKKKKVEQR